MLANVDVKSLHNAAKYGNGVASSPKCRLTPLISQLRRLSMILHPAVIGTLINAIIRGYKRTVLW
jgi:hypothetical protein